MEKLCLTLEISRGGYYAWKSRKPGKRRQANQILLRRMVLLHVKYPALGLDSLFHLLRPEFSCSRARVHRLMQQASIHSLRKRAYRATTNSRHSYPIAPNLLQRHFHQSQPNKVWVGDITYILAALGITDREYYTNSFHVPVYYPISSYYKHVEVLMITGFAPS